MSPYETTTWPKSPKSAFLPSFDHQLLVPCSLKCLSFPPSPWPSVRVKSEYAYEEYLWPWLISNRCIFDLTAVFADFCCFLPSFRHVLVSWAVILPRYALKLDMCVIDDDWLGYTRFLDATLGRNWCRRWKIRLLAPKTCQSTNFRVAWSLLLSIMSLNPFYIATIDMWSYCKFYIVITYPLDTFL